MSKTIIAYMDDEGNEVSEEKATRINIVELDDNGNRIKETYMVSADSKEKETVKVSDSDEINTELFSSIKWNIPRDPLQEKMEQLERENSKKS